VLAYNQYGESASSNTVLATVQCGVVLLSPDTAAAEESPVQSEDLVSEAAPTQLETPDSSLPSPDVAPSTPAAAESEALTGASDAPIRRAYYFLGGQRVAMRQVAEDPSGVVYWLVGDHLGSTSLVLNANGTVHSEARYYPYGAERWASGTLPTDYRFTGQRDTGLGLYHMGARFYDAYLARWLSADTIVPEPGNPQSLNRYSWVLGNPLNAVDPGGHGGSRPNTSPKPFKNPSQTDPLQVSQLAVDNNPSSLRQFLIDAVTFNIFDIGTTGENRPTQHLDRAIRSAYGDLVSFTRSLMPEPLLEFTDAVGALLSEPEIQMGIQAALMTVGGPPGSWQAYEQRFGTTKLPIQIQSGGANRTIIPDFSTPYYHIDYKAYSWSNPVYEKPFMQEVVIAQFLGQTEDYLATGNPLIFQFSEPPPQWLVDILDSLSMEVDVYWYVQQ
jgi:RHS repeat-associated protein